MDNLILITQLNDFIFCPASIYFHQLYGNTARIEMQSSAQINGSAAHKTIDEGHYSTRKNVLQGIDVFCEEYGLVGKIDLYYADRKLLVERKKNIKRIYDGYIFQIYAQYFAMIEMGYKVEMLQIRSLDNNKNYVIKRPEEDVVMLNKFKNTIDSMHSFDMTTFIQSNQEKCRHCIYEPACDRGGV